MLLVASRGLLLLLLALDWVEDPHFGKYIFSAIMNSTPVSSLDLGFDVGGARDCEAVAEHQAAHNAEFGFCATLPCLPYQEVRCSIASYSVDRLYFFMSLQQ